MPCLPGAGNWRYSSGMRNPLIIGGNGTVSRALAARLKKAGLTPRLTTRRKDDGEGIYLDLASPPSEWPDLPEADVVFFCAGMTKLETCEDNPAATRQVNVEHMQELADRVDQKGGFVIFLSSNQVFDGSKPFRLATESVCPLNEYGRQKAIFEKWLLSRPRPGAVLRLTKIIENGTMPIFEQWKEKLEANRIIKAFYDLRFAPLPLNSVLDGMMDLALRKRSGTYHLSGLDDISYYDLACAFAVSLGRKEGQVKSTRASEAGIRPQFLPKNATLDRSTMSHIHVPQPLECFEGTLRPAKVLLRDSIRS
jgi:dTDP-4-dehydrorhamnose reductase